MDLGGSGGRADAFFQGFDTDTLPTERVPLLYCFEISKFGDGPLGLWSQQKLILGVGARQKRNFLVNFSKKCLKKPFVACFFKSLPAAHKIWPKQGLLNTLGEIRKSFWST